MNYFEQGSIPFTDSHEEMQKIGKELYHLRPDIYTESVESSLLCDLRSFVQQGSYNEKFRMTFYETIYHYWVFGCNISEYYRYGFDKKSVIEKADYLTAKNRLPYIWHLNRYEEQHKFNDKYETYQMLKPYYHREMLRISSEDDYESFKDFMRRQNGRGGVLVKPQAGSIGAGVYKINVQPGSEKEVFEQILEKGKELLEKNKFLKVPSSVVEEFIEQDDTMASLHPASVNAVRLTTIRVQEKVHFFYPWLKIGMNGAVATGSYQGASMDAGIDVQTGIINTRGYTKHGTVFEKHPNTDVSIVGFQIPNWDDLLELAEVLAKSLSDFRYVGWDFALNKKGEWCVIEGNCGGNQEGQWVHNRGLKPEFEKIVNWKPDSEFWWKNK